MRKVYDWDSGVYLGEIPEATETYNVVGNTNEHGLVIGETTFGGVEELAWTQTDGKIDYGSLIYISKNLHPQRKKNPLSWCSLLADIFLLFRLHVTFSVPL